MKIHNLRIAQFAHWQHEQLLDLDDGLTVVAARTEADKAALLVFLRGLLAGDRSANAVSSSDELAAGWLEVSSTGGRCILRRSKARRGDGSSELVASRTPHGDREPDLVPTELVRADPYQLVDRIVVRLPDHTHFADRPVDEQAAELAARFRQACPDGWSTLAAERQNLLSTKGDDCTTRLLVSRRGQLVTKLVGQSSRVEEYTRLRRERQTIQSRIEQLGQKHAAAQSRILQLERHYSAERRQRRDQIETLLAEVQSNVASDSKLQAKRDSIGEQIDRLKRRQQEIARQLARLQAPTESHPALQTARRVVAQQRELADHEIALTGMVQQLGRIRGLLGRTCCAGDGTQDELETLGVRLRKLEVELADRRRSLSRFANEAGRHLASTEAGDNNPGRPRLTEKDRRQHTTLTAESRRAGLQLDQLQSRFDELERLCQAKRADDDRQRRLAADARDLLGKLLAEIDRLQPARKARADDAHQLRRLRDEYDSLSEQLRVERNQLDRIDARIKQWDDDDRASRTRHAIQKIDAAIKNRVARWHVLSLTLAAGAAANTDESGWLRRRVAHYLQGLSGGSWVDTRLDGNGIWLVDAAGTRHSLTLVGQPDRNLLLGCLRLAQAESAPDRLPLLIDDCARNDVEIEQICRLVELLPALVEHGRQVVLLTGHQRVAKHAGRFDLTVRRLGPDVTSRRTERRSAVDDRYKQAEIGDSSRHEVLDGYDDERRLARLADRYHVVAESTPSRSRQNHRVEPVSRAKESADTVPFSSPASVRRRPSPGAADLRFYLNLSDPVEAAPSIGPKYAERLERIGIVTVSDLLSRDPQDAARLADRDIKAKHLKEWQLQASLVCRIPQLRGHDAQILVACGITEPERLAGMHADELFAVVRPFVRTKAGKRILRGGNAPDLAEVRDWIHWAQQSRILSAA